MTQEVIIYIHGVSSDRAGRSHAPEYDALHKGIKKRIAENSAWHDAKVCKTEWGWNYKNKPIAHRHEVLTVGQTILSERVRKAFAEASWDLTINPARHQLNKIREMMIDGFSDMFYYVSTEGKNAIRAAIVEQIANCVGGAIDQKDSLVSLTLIGHSAGSVIAFDLAFYLFSGKNYPFIKGTPKKSATLLNKLRALADQKNPRVRLRRLITFGSPITMMACRNNAVAELLANGGKMDPKMHGLKPDPSAFDDGLRGARWLNFWDKDDPIAFPVKPLMDDSQSMVEDIYTDVSDWLRSAHDAYWSTPEVHNIIAERW